MIRIGNCLQCGKDLGLMTSKVLIKSGWICEECFNKAGFRANDANDTKLVSNMSLEEYQEASRKLLSTPREVADWNDPEFVLRKVRNLITHPNIALKKDETCFFQTKGSIGKKKTRTIKKGKKSHKETYYEKTSCDFYMTSERFIATVPQGSGFVIRMNNVLGLSMHKDSFEINNNGKSVLVFMPQGELKRLNSTMDVVRKFAQLGLSQKDLLDDMHSDRIANKKKTEDLIVETVIETEIEIPSDMGSNSAKSDSISEPGAKEQGKNDSADKDNAPFDAVNEIRRYKALLDEGIITQEEFDKKKQQLLSI